MSSWSCGQLFYRRQAILLRDKGRACVATRSEGNIENGLGFDKTREERKQLRRVLRRKMSLKAGEEGACVVKGDNGIFDDKSLSLTLARCQRHCLDYYNKEENNNKE